VQGAGGRVHPRRRAHGARCPTEGQDAPKAQAHKRRVSFHKRARTVASRGHFTKEIQCGA
jgi:hypothetical protein